MKKARNALGRWIQRIASKSRAGSPAQAAQRPQELDTQALTQVGGGLDSSSQTPNKGW